MKNIFISLLLFGLWTGSVQAQVRFGKIPVIFDYSLNNTLFKDSAKGAAKQPSTDNDIFAPDRQNDRSNIIVSPKKGGSDTGSTKLETVMEQHFADTMVTIWTLSAGTGRSSMGLITNIGYDSDRILFTMHLPSNDPGFYKASKTSEPTRNLSFALKKVKVVIRDKKHYKSGDVVYGYLEGEVPVFYEQLPGSKTLKTHNYTFSGYFRCKLADFPEVVEPKTEPKTLSPKPKAPAGH
jgi:hypothetical protein